MKLPYYPLLLLSIFFLFACEGTGEEPAPDPGIELTESQKATLEILNTELSPISSTPLSIPNADLSALDRVGDVKIVGLGEATHGTKEFFQMKHRIFKYLVEKHGFKAFLFEMDLAEALIFEEWIQGNNNTDLAQLMRTKMIFWTWRTAEVEALFRWMKTYNEGKNEADRIHLYGVDNQFTRYNLDNLADRLQAIDPPLADSVRIFNITLKNISNLYPNKNQSDADKIDAGIEQTFALLEREKNRIISLSSSTEFMWMERLARHMEQVATYLYEYHFQNNFRLRDQFMAENTLWYQELLGADAKLVLWAHNAHVAKNPFYGNAPSQGGHLKSALGNDYQVLAFGFSKGSFTAFGNQTLGVKQITGEPPVESYNFIFNRANSPAFIIEMTNIQSQNLKDWFSLEKKFLSLGCCFDNGYLRYYNTVPLTTHFDYLVYFDETQNSELL